MRLKRSYSKYRAVRTEVDGLRFDSKREAAHYSDLRIREKAGEIRQLRCQVPLVLSVGPHAIGKHVIDFVYEEQRDQDWCLRWDEVKGFDAPLGKWKRKHAEAQYGITIRVIK